MDSAIPFAVLLVFNNTILVDDGRGIWHGWFVIVPIVCYSCFVVSSNSGYGYGLFNGICYCLLLTHF